MNTTTATTRVKFYMEGKGVLAVFPDIPERNKYRDDLLLCYSHVGQHSSCEPEYIKKKRLANPEEYKDLLNELKGQGYDNLEVAHIKKSKKAASYLVEIQYVSKAGNPLARTKVIKADDPEQAMASLQRRIESFENFMKINGGTAQLINA